MTTYLAAPVLAVAAGALTHDWNVALGGAILAWLAPVAVHGIAGTARAAWTTALFYPLCGRAGRRGRVTLALVGHVRGSPTVLCRAGDDRVKRVSSCPLQKV
jgi:hypothetical protein